CQQESNWPQTF
nr:immunoglobulin light chain junction region [Macaca mulatta]